MTSHVPQECTRPYLSVLDTKLSTQMNQWKKEKLTCEFINLHTPGSSFSILFAGAWCPIHGIGLKDILTTQTMAAIFDGKGEEALYSCHLSTFSYGIFPMHVIISIQNREYSFKTWQGSLWLVSPTTNAEKPYQQQTNWTKLQKLSTSGLSVNKSFWETNSNLHRILKQSLRWSKSGHGRATHRTNWNLP